MTIRKVKDIVLGETQYDGAGVKLVRVLGRPTIRDFDPFLMLDAFDSCEEKDYIKGFPWHPHRGIETVTYLISGEIEHGDSLGNRGVINDGDCQWMTAGRGIIHQEMPQPSECMVGVQLWLNLPKASKMAEPQYNDITAEMIPKIEEKNSEVRVLSGIYNEVHGAMQANYVDMLFLDVSVNSGANWTVQTDSESTLFIYIIQGAAKFGVDNKTEIASKQAVLFEQGDEFSITATEHGVRFLLFTARPLQESIAWGGPIVMNTDEELTQAFAEIKAGTFINHGNGEKYSEVKKKDYKIDKNNKNNTKNVDKVHEEYYL